MIVRVTYFKWKDQADGVRDARSKTLKWDFKRLINQRRTRMPDDDKQVQWT